MLWSHPLSITLLLASEPLPNLETVKANYIAAVTAIDTLDCTMRHEWEVIYPKGAPVSEGVFAAEHMQLWRKGTMRALNIQSYHAGGKPAVISWYGYDGKTYSHWVIPHPDSGVTSWLPAGAITSEKDNTISDSLTLERFTGEALHAGDFPLKDLLERPGTEVKSRTIVDGTECVHVKTGLHPRSRKSAGKNVVETEVDLDPQHDYLPRRILWRDFHKGESTPPTIYEFQTTEFRRVRGQDGHDYWLPAAGERKAPRLKFSRWKLLEATVNAPIPTERFRPQFPEGTEVREQLANQPRRVRITGDPKLRKQKEQEIFDELLQQQETKSSSPPANPFVVAPSARPSDATGRWWAGLLRWAGILLCALVVAYGWRTWRVSRS